MLGMSSLKSADCLASCCAFSVNLCKACWILSCCKCSMHSRAGSKVSMSKFYQWQSLKWWWSLLSKWLSDQRLQNSWYQGMPLWPRGPMGKQSWVSCQTLQTTMGTYGKGFWRSHTPYLSLLTRISAWPTKVISPKVASPSSLFLNSGTLLQVPVLWCQAKHQVHLHKQRNWSFPHTKRLPSWSPAEPCDLEVVEVLFSSYMIHADSMSCHHRQCRSHLRNRGLPLGSCPTGAMLRYHLKRRSSILQVRITYSVFQGCKHCLASIGQWASQCKKPGLQAIPPSHSWALTTYWPGKVQSKTKTRAQRSPPKKNDNTCNAVGIPPPITYTYLETRFNKCPEILFLNIEKG